MTPETKRVYDAIKSLPSIGGFILVGGTAISIHADHRLSLDLDFATTGKKLDKAAIKTIINELQKSFKVEQVTNVAATEDFENDGMDLAEYHQDWLVDGIKVTFFVFGDNDQEKSYIAKRPILQDGAARVLDMDGLFVTKCLVLCDRIKSRDLYDLWWYVKHGGHDISEVFNTIQELRPHITYETIRYRLLEWAIPQNDEGLEPVINITIDQVRKELAEEIKKMEVRLAKDIKTQSYAPPRPKG